MLQNANQKVWDQIDTAYHKNPEAYQKGFLLKKLTPLLLPDDARDSRLQQKQDKECGFDTLPASAAVRKRMEKALKQVGKNEVEKAARLENLTHARRKEITTLIKNEPMLEKMIKSKKVTEKTVTQNKNKSNFLINNYFIKNNSF